jgi:site-specific DNA recombinase
VDTQHAATVNNRISARGAEGVAGRGAGEISVLSGAPYGYRYIRKSDDAPASYAVIDAEARVVRQVYEHYTAVRPSAGNRLVGGDRPLFGVN